MMHCLPHFKKFKAFSILNAKDIKSGGLIRHALVRIRDLPLTLSRLEFAVVQDDNNLCWFEFLVRVAQTLEQLLIRAPQSDKLHKTRLLTLPNLPRLRLITIVVPNDPDLSLEFDTASPEDGCILNYASQFPVLQRLEVIPEGVSPDKESWFESCLLFLYSSFLSQKGTPSTSLRFLDVPTPSRVGSKKWSLESGSGSPINSSVLVFRRHPSTCPWEEAAEFYFRVETTFPNLVNIPRHTHNCNGDEVGRDAEKLREWLKFGEQLGLLEACLGFK